jgi:hypothetical protein
MSNSGAMSAHWKGTDAERIALLACLERNCECADGQGQTCSAHKILIAPNAQKMLDALLFYRRFREYLERKEDIANRIPLESTAPSSRRGKR